MAETRQPGPNNSTERMVSRSPSPNAGNGDAVHNLGKGASGDDDWDGEWDEEGEEDEALVLEDDPEELATWSGHASVKGSSEVVRMLLLNFNAIGMTCVAPLTCHNEPCLCQS